MNHWVMRGIFQPTMLNYWITIPNGPTVFPDAWWYHQHSGVPVVALICFGFKEGIGGPFWEKLNKTQLGRVWEEFQDLGSEARLISLPDFRLSHVESKRGRVLLVAPTVLKYQRSCRSTRSSTL